MFFVYAAQAGVLSLIRKIRVASSWIVMDGRVSGAVAKDGRPQ
jgi:hypothetical protein